MFLKLVFGDSFIDVEFMIIIEHSSITIMDLISQTITSFIVNLTVNQTVNIFCIVAQITYHCMCLILHQTAELFI